MPESKRYTALVVDNNPFIVKTLSTFLSKENCDVLIAENGLEALEVLKKETVNIVFTDLVMPFVEGDVLCRIIRSKPELSEVYVVILSAIATEAKDGILADVPYDLCFEKGHISQMKQQVRDALCGLTSKKAGQKQQLPPSSQPVENETTSITNELLSRTNYLNSILSNLNEGVIELNHQGLVIGINPAAELFFSRTKEQCIGQALSTLCADESFNSQLRLWQKQALALGKGDHLSITENSPLFFGDRVLTCTASVVAESHPPVGMCIFHDITRQYQAEAHKKKVQSALGGMRKMEAMRDMAGGFAHDFNNLLTAICGNLDILQAVEASFLSERASKIVENTKKAAGMAVDLTKKISTFSDFGIVERERTNIQDFLTSCSESYFSHSATPYHLSLEKEDLWFEVNRQEVEEAFTNIFENSLESLNDETSSIAITQQKLSFSEPFLISNQYIPAGEYVKIDIEDKGCGISSDDMTHIFDPYFSNKERSSVKGLGLGLAVVYSVMRSHGGYVVAESEPDVGTVISLYFPFKQKATPTSQPCSLVFIEQDDQLRNETTALIEFLGIQVYPFTSEAHALTFYTHMVAGENRATTTPQRICVLGDFSDHTPHEIKVMRQKWQDFTTDVILICSYDDSESKKDGVLAQKVLNNVLAKPYSVAKFQKVFSQHGLLSSLQ